MFQIVGALLGIAGVGSLLLLGVLMFIGALKEYDGVDYWISVIGAAVRNTLMAVSGYAAFRLPIAAPALAWAAFGIYVATTAGLQWVKSGSIRVSDFIGTFYVAASLIAVSAALLTALEPSNA
ncbi:hypothetical protein FDP08_14095 [Marinobacter panjinensis]|uniref:Uncharacterized protein n=1 Tax=Marinobacter panjinensis TaxID=2576384 RepID=A0A4U6R6I2_9GAMM|nr:hypothetical protein [Marinobacter panjinensis]TKV69143.1 hypothetical protein FDP08_14095 [Marinobacter panjinensis]